MIDSDFWRELAAQFQSVDKYDHTLMAIWNQEIGSDHVRWELSGAESTKSEFDPLARRGGIRLNSSSSVDLLSTWLNAVKVEISPGDRDGTGYSKEDTGEEKHFKFGTIHRISFVSAQLCKKVESRSLEKERLAALRQPKPTSVLIEHANALYAQNIQAFRREQANRFADVTRLDMSPLGRAVEREEILVDILTRQMTERIRLYGKVAEEQSCPEMLAKPLLDKLREDIMTGVRFARIALVERNEQDAQAAGQYDQAAFQASRTRLEATIEPTLLSVVNAELGVLETNPLALGLLKPKETEAPPSEPPKSVETGPETTGQQIRRLRDECRWSEEVLASKVGRDPTTVSRNESDKLAPQARNLAAYERVFSKELKRQVVINKTPRKRL